MGMKMNGIICCIIIIKYSLIRKWHSQFIKKKIRLGIVSSGFPHIKQYKFNIKINKLVLI